MWRGGKRRRAGSSLLLSLLLLASRAQKDALIAMQIARFDLRIERVVQKRSASDPRVISDLLLRLFYC